MEAFVTAINNVIWSPALVYLCLGAGLFYSVQTRFAQVRLVREMWRLLFAKNSSTEGISSFQALAVSLSGRVGVGNIAGVAAAIGFGGPGAVFWMWVVAFLGASTAYAESTLGQLYKVEEDGQYRGGPAYYFERCLGQRWLAVLFAVSAIVACGMFLPGVQANAVGNAVTQIFGEGSIVATQFGDVGTNKLVALAVSSPQRIPGFPELPTIAEAGRTLGLADFDISTWFGLFGPAGLPAEVTARLNKAFVAALDAPETRARMAAMMAAPSPTTPEQFGAFVKAELAKYGPVVKASGAKVD